MSNKMIKFSKNIVDYAWRQLAFRAGVKMDPDGQHLEKLGISVFYKQPKKELNHQPSIYVIPCSEDSWEKAIKKPKNSLDFVSIRHSLPQGTKLPLQDDIPVLFWGRGYEDGKKPFAEIRDDGKVIFYADIISSALFMLTRWEESVIESEDQHGRFPAASSTAYRQGFLDRPVVDEYAVILRECLKKMAPGWKPEKKEFTVSLSHDIDKIQPFSTLGIGARKIVGDFLKRRDIVKAIQSLNKIFKQIFYPFKTDEIQGIYFLAELSYRYGFFEDSFYFMTNTDDPFGAGYSLENPVLRKVIRDLQNMEFEIGFHPSYKSYLDVARLEEEKSDLETFLGESIDGGRQHYLRFKAPRTWRDWEAVGMKYDSSLGYADYEGFRCGTCHPFKPFDIDNDREIDIVEIPLIVMDGTLKKYREMSPEEGMKKILYLADRCKAVGGTFTLLWHNTSLYGEWKSWSEMYQKVVAELASL